MFLLNELIKFGLLFFILNKKGLSKKFLMSAASMSR